ncbi:hypothetical protein KIKIMORA_03350 [Brevundimonas phage vB_BpoS-Kikimora]|uniref:Uncharacterized protein n=1 Tax=Brevundimonas phage vB_BpoS-Kikimora TaxID=2948601 RepID=A0A9E7SMV2_9CAUD|nr:hypothetical protein KIKIMORA_03350 [Brevundimonas phage vB_BpoS-Kikimora]
MVVVADWRELYLYDLDFTEGEKATIFSAYFHPTVKLGDLVKHHPKPWFYNTELAAKAEWLVAEAQMQHPVRDTHRDLPILPPIDYAWLGQAIAFYKDAGYRYVEAPWAVSEESVAITCPKPEFTAKVEGLGALVGSSEQSFLHLDLSRQLGKGRFVACTPCFRLGDDYDALHFPTFMKVELYDNTATTDIGWKTMLADAYALAVRLGAPEDGLESEKTEEGFDLTLAGIEIGSFGWRRYQDHLWSYGTGLALPRFTQALEMHRALAARR